MGIPVIGLSCVFCVNQSVVINATAPALVLNKRYNAICYNCMREAETAGIICVSWIPGQANLADLAVHKDNHEREC